MSILIPFAFAFIFLFSIFLLVFGIQKAYIIAIFATSKIPPHLQKSGWWGWWAWLTAVSMIGVVLIGISVILLHRKIIKLQHELGEL